MKIGLFIKKEVINESTLMEIKEKVLSFGHVVVEDNPELVISFGGDGTFLKAVHFYLLKNDKIIFAPINKGKLGFFSDFVMDDLDEIFRDLSKFEVKSFSLLEANIGKESIYAVNEIRIENPFHTLISEVFINGTKLETFRGNGLVVSSSIGSSAYNKSLGGAVVDTSLEVMQLSEIAPINNSLYRSLKSPLIVSKDSKIRFKGAFKDIVIGYDHLVKSDFRSNEITFSISNKKLNLLVKKGHDHIAKLSEAFISSK